MKVKSLLCGFKNEEGSKFCKNFNEPLSKQDCDEDTPYAKKTLKKKKCEQKSERFKFKKLKRRGRI